jgi:hypothetical protein
MKSANFAVLREKRPELALKSQTNIARPFIMSTTASPCGPGNP